MGLWLRVILFAKTYIDRYLFLLIFAFSDYFRKKNGNSLGNN